VRLVAADVAVAREAVLQPSDLGRDGWERIPPRSDIARSCSDGRNLSRLTVTGMARSSFEGGLSRIESRVLVFANARQAARFVRAKSNRKVFRCLRDVLRRPLENAGLKTRLVYGRFRKTPRIGSQTAISVFGYVLRLRSGRRFEYPVNVLVFRVGRAIGAVTSVMIPSADGSRPYESELDQANRMARRLAQAHAVR
jgi:hypothetical protein